MKKYLKLLFWISVISVFISQACVEVLASEYEIIVGDDFSDGVAWVYASDENGDFVGIIDTDGNLISKVEEAFILEDASHLYYSFRNDYYGWHSDFENGTAWLYLGEGYVLIDKNGNILTDVFDEIEKCGDYYLVIKKAAGYEQSADKVGILNYKAEWVVEPVDVGSNEGLDFILDNRYESLTWRWDDADFFIYQGYRGYNIGQDIVFDMQRVNDRYTPDVLGYYDGKILTYLNDISVHGDGEEMCFYVYDGLGKVQSSFTIPGLQNEALREAVFIDGVTWVIGTNNDMFKGAVVDMSGNVLLDMSELGNIKIIDIVGCQENYAGIEIAGMDGSYYTVIDLSQKGFAFEPVKVDGIGGLSSGISLIEVDGKIRALDLQGNVLFEYKGDVDDCELFYDEIMYEWQSKNYVTRDGYILDKKIIAENEDLLPVSETEYTEEAVSQEVYDTTTEMMDLRELPYIGNSRFDISLSLDVNGNIVCDGVTEQGILGSMQLDFDGNGQEELLIISYNKSNLLADGRNSVSLTMYTGDSGVLVDSVELVGERYQGELYDLTTMNEPGSSFFEGILFIREQNGKYQIFFESGYTSLFASGQGWRLTGYTYDENGFVKIPETEALFYEGSGADDIWTLDEEALDEWGLTVEAEIVKTYRELGFDQTMQIGYGYLTAAQDLSCYPLIRFVSNMDISGDEARNWFYEQRSGTLEGLWFKIEDYTADFVENYVEKELEETVQETVSSEYILPNSATEYITREQLANLDINYLCLARNEIFARHGRSFITPEISAYFESKSWYTAQYSGEEFDAMMYRILSEVEFANIELIKTVEAERGNPSGTLQGPIEPLEDILSTESSLSTDGSQRLQSIEKQDAELYEKYQAAMSQAEMNSLAYQLYQLWDVELNEIWGELRDTLDSATMSQLTQEQVQWISLKESDAEQEAAQYEGGSMQPMVYSITAYTWTKERVYELVEYLP